MPAAKRSLMRTAVARMTGGKAAPDALPERPQRDLAYFQQVARVLHASAPDAWERIVAAASAATRPALLALVDLPGDAAPVD